MGQGINKIGLSGLKALKNKFLLILMVLRRF